MPTSSYTTYMQPWFDSMAQGTRVAESLRQAAMQQQQLQQAHDQFQQDMALRNQEFQAKQQGDLATALAAGSRPIDASGNVNVAAPVAQSSLTPSPAASPFAAQPGASAPLPTGASSMTPSLNFGTGATANVAADTSRGSVSIGGQKLQPQTPDDKFQEQLGQQGQLQEQSNRIGLQNAINLRNATFVPLPKKTTDAMALPEGYSVDPKSIPEWLNAGTNATKASTDRLNSDVVARETTATMLAKQYGITLVPGKSAFSQLTPELQLQALTTAKESTADPDLKANTLATGASTRATAEAVRANLAQTNQTNAIKQQNLQEAGAQLTPASAKQVAGTETILSQVDELRHALEGNNAKGIAYKDDNNPLALAGPMAMYRAGIKSPDGTLGGKISDVSLAALQGVQQYLGKSRNIQYVRDVQQHAPSLKGLTPDSPALVYQKFGTMERNFLRIKANTVRYGTVKTGVNPANPTLQPTDIQRYYNLAGGDPNVARQMATQDGWTIPQSIPQAQ